jgi:hypothetical protein
MSLFEVCTHSVQPPEREEKASPGGAGGQLPEGALGAMEVVEEDGPDLQERGGEPPVRPREDGPGARVARQREMQQPAPRPLGPPAAHCGLELLHDPRQRPSPLLIERQR